MIALGVGLRPLRRHDLPVDRDLARRDHLLGMSARGCPCGGDQFLQTLFHIYLRSSDGFYHVTHRFKVDVVQGKREWPDLNVDLTAVCELLELSKLQLAAYQLLRLPGINFTSLRD